MLRKAISLYQTTAFPLGSYKSQIAKPNKFKAEGEDTGLVYSYSSNSAWRRFYSISSINKNPGLKAAAGHYLGSKTAMAVTLGRTNPCRYLPRRSEQPIIIIRAWLRAWSLLVDYARRKLFQSTAHERDSKWLDGMPISWKLRDGVVSSA